MSDNQVSDILAQAFVAEGVDTLFTLMGDANMYWSASMVDNQKVRLIHARHEHCCVAMAGLRPRYWQGRGRLCDLRPKHRARRRSTAGERMAVQHAFDLGLTDDAALVLLLLGEAQQILSAILPSFRRGRGCALCHWPRCRRKDRRDGVGSTSRRHLTQVAKFNTNATLGQP
jgi:hypothetical protein